MLGKIGKRSSKGKQHSIPIASGGMLRRMEEANGLLYEYVHKYTHDFPREVFRRNLLSYLLLGPLRKSRAVSQLVVRTLVSIIVARSLLGWGTPRQKTNHREICVFDG